VRNEETQRIGLGLGCGRSIKRFIVKGADYQTKSLVNNESIGILETLLTANHTEREREENKKKLTFATASWRPLTVKILSTAPRE
jgi:hypothetical protein